MRIYRLIGEPKRRAKDTNAEKGEVEPAEDGSEDGRHLISVPIRLQSVNQPVIGRGGFAIDAARGESCTATLLRAPVATNFSSLTLGFITVTAVLLGCALRLAWPLEIEYKADEAYMFARSQQVGVSEPWPALGMPSGAGGVRNPGLSVWVFVGLAKITGVTTPVGLARVVQGVNCAALVALGIFALRFAGTERRIWLWALNLAALSPTAILLQRKIWAQSVLPLLCVLMLTAWWQRRTFFGAVGWAALCLAAAQIHMTGFFVFAALILWTLLFRRDSMHWRGLALGVLIGGLTLVPWLRSTWFDGHAAGSAPRLWHVFSGEFWRLWVTEGFGLGLGGNFGADWLPLMRGPTWGGHNTWLVGAAEMGLLGILAWFFGQVIAELWSDRGQWRGGLAKLGAGNSETTFLRNALVIGYGVLLSLPDFNLFRHYLLITFPLAYVWLAALALQRGARWAAVNEKLLLVALTLNLFVALHVFAFLRENGGARGGDFGVSWRAQAAAGAIKP